MPTFTNAHRRDENDSLVAGFLLPFRGAAFLWRNRGLKRYAILPLILNAVLYAAVIALAVWLIGRWQIGLAEWDFWGPVGRWLAAAVNWLGGGLKALAVLGALLVAYFTFTAVGMVVASPLNDLLSEKVENAFVGPGAKVDLPLRFTTKAAMLSVWDSLANLCRQLFYSLLAVPFLFIPLIGFIPLFSVGAYFGGFGFVDTAMARNYLRLGHKRLMLREKRRTVIGFGVAMQLAFAVPFLGLLLLPVGVTAGTMLYCSLDWRRLFAEAGMPPPEGFRPPGESTRQDAPEATAAIPSAGR